jgi:hypothetical protein
MLPAEYLPDPEHDSFTRLGRDFDAAPEKGRQALDDGQADAESLDGPVCLLVASVKLSEVLAELIRRDADAGVPNLDISRRSLAPTADQHAAPFRIPDRVGNQVPQYLFQEHRVGVHFDVRIDDDQVQAFFGRLGGKLFAEPLD